MHAALLAPALALALTLPAVAVAAAQEKHSDALDVVGLTVDQQLVNFSDKAPSSPRSLGHIRGLVKDSKLVGIDYRVQNGKLYGVGDRGGIYTKHRPPPEPGLHRSARRHGHWGRSHGHRSQVSPDTARLRCSPARGLTDGSRNRCCTSGP
ncbi:DUF4394 domain-containing protein [Streptomyces sp. HMX112]|uniref:DUF4394 domain-containing protein n=1 Tax=Streptomyces sp. HMX112 TaxID=3390850 RepID=UPI003A801F17